MRGSTTVAAALSCVALLASPAAAEEPAVVVVVEGVSGAATRAIRADLSARGLRVTSVADAGAVTARELVSIQLGPGAREARVQLRSPRGVEHRAIRAPRPDPSGRWVVAHVTSLVRASRATTQRQSDAVSRAPGEVLDPWRSAGVAAATAARTDVVDPWTRSSFEPRRPATLSEVLDPWSWGGQPIARVPDPHVVREVLDPWASARKVR